MEGSMGQTESEKLLDQIRYLVQSTEMVGAAVLPSSSDELLQSIVEAAARIFGAAASSILLLDEENQELVFKVAHNSGDSQVIGLRTPMDKGIAGYVVMTGQPIAVSNVEDDARFNRDFAAKTGYIPRSILATPLLSDEKVIGVMEVLDKINAASFGMQDMELLGRFARQAAIAINQAQQFDQMGAVLIQGLRGILASHGSEPPSELFEAMERAQAEVPPDLLDLAHLFNEIAALGVSERKMCIQVLEAFRTYRQSKRLPR